MASVVTKAAATAHPLQNTGPILVSRGIELTALNPRAPKLSWQSDIARILYCGRPASLHNMEGIHHRAGLIGGHA
jgi:hypothetical protein